MLRNWERNGLLCVPRRPPNATRVYGDAELARLRVIYMLRQNHYSIASIYRSLLRYDSGDGAGALLALHQPGEDEELPYVSAGDHWLETLAEAAAGAEKIRRMVWELRAQPSN